MKLEARQNATNANPARSNDAKVNNCWAKTNPTKIARFFVHCRGRIATMSANKRPLIPSLRGAGGAPVVVEYSTSLCCSVCFSKAIIVYSAVPFTILRHGSNTLDSFTELNKCRAASLSVRNAYETVQTVKFDAPKLNLALKKIKKTLSDS